MGMFVTSEGTSQRAPLSWLERLLALGYSFPYAVALGANSISVHRSGVYKQLTNFLHFAFLFLVPICNEQNFDNVH